MKNSIQIVLGLLLFILLFVACKSAKTDKKENAKNAINKKTPFIVTKATYQNWYGGVKDVKGVKIIILGKDLKKEVTFKSLYYLDKKVSLQTNNKENSFTLEVSINTSTKERQLILHNNSQNEYGNIPPVKSKYPNLKENEAIITYFQKGKKADFKINLKKEMDLFYR